MDVLSIAQLSFDEELRQNRMSTLELVVYDMMCLKGNHNLEIVAEIEVWVKQTAILANHLLAKEYMAGEDSIFHFHRICRDLYDYSLTTIWTAVQ